MRGSCAVGYAQAIALALDTYVQAALALSPLPTTMSPPKLSSHRRAAHLDNELKRLVHSDVFLVVLTQNGLRRLVVRADGRGLPPTVVAAGVALVQLEPVMLIPVSRVRTQQRTSPHPLLSHATSCLHEREGSCIAAAGGGSKHAPRRRARWVRTQLGGGVSEGKGEGRFSPARDEERDTERPQATVLRVTLLGVAQVLHQLLHRHGLLVPVCVLLRRQPAKECDAHSERFGVRRGWSGGERKWTRRERRACVRRPVSRTSKVSVRGDPNLLYFWASLTPPLRVGSHAPCLTPHVSEADSSVGGEPSSTWVTRSCLNRSLHSRSLSSLSINAPSSVDEDVGVRCNTRHRRADVVVQLVHFLRGLRGL
jgi:hypothetical protein